MKRRKHTGVWLMLAPLYIFTLLFVAGPLIYMVVLSFQQRAEVWGVVHTFTLENYKNILTPVYLQTFAESFKLALTSTALITLILAVYSSAEKMDWSLVEAARDLGASPLRAFCTVTLKLTLPGLLSGIILTFIPSMGLFFIADILGGNKVVLVGSLIQDQLMKAHNQPFAAALSLVLMVLTTLMISLYKRITHSSELEGLL